MGEAGRKAGALHGGALVARSVGLSLYFLIALFSPRLTPGTPTSGVLRLPLFLLPICDLYVKPGRNMASSSSCCRCPACGMTLED
jgi:hypothetical protein